MNELMNCQKNFGGPSSGKYNLFFVYALDMLLPCHVNVLLESLVARVVAEVRPVSSRMCSITDNRHFTLFQRPQPEISLIVVFAAQPRVLIED